MPWPPPLPWPLEVAEGACGSAAGEVVAPVLVGAGTVVVCVGSWGTVPLVTIGVELTPLASWPTVELAIVGCFGCTFWPELPSE